MIIRLTLPGLLFAAAATALLAQPPAPNVTPIATGLDTPMKIVRTAGGNLLVTEAGKEKNGGRVTRLTRSGTKTAILEGLPSFSTPEGQSGPNGLIVDAQGRLIVAIGEGDMMVSGPRPGSLIPNPAGPSSPLFSSLLLLDELSAPIDNVTAPFRVSDADTAALADGQRVKLTNANNQTAWITVLHDFRDYTPDAAIITRASNPFGLALDPARPNTLYVTDAGQNAVWTVNLETGRARVVGRIPQIRQEAGVLPPVSDAVPTSVRVFDGKLLVSLLTGFPFAPGAGRVLLMDPATGAIEPFINGLTSVMDVDFQERPNGRPRFYTLEFSGSMTAQPPLPGRLQQFDTPAGTQIAPVLITPVSMALDAAAGELYVTEMALGRVSLVKTQ